MTQYTKLIDVHAAFGGAVNPNAPWIAKKDILGEMKRLVISRAVVRPLLPQRGGDVVVANQRLFKNCAKNPRLIPCPLMIPASGGDDLPPDDEQTDRFIKQGARMVWIRPEPDRYNLSEVVSGVMFNALADRRLPVLCLMDLISWADMDMILRRHPELRIVAANVWVGQLRIVLPMLKAYSNFYLTTGRGAADHNFLPVMERAGVIHKVFFGTGFPEAEPMMAVTQLMYADISEQNRRAVGAENITRLLAEVKHPVASRGAAYSAEARPLGLLRRSKASGCEGRTAKAGSLRNHPKPKTPSCPAIAPLERRRIPPVASHRASWRRMVKQ